MIRGCMMIRSREAKRVVVVAADSSLHPLFLSSYRRLGVLAAEGMGCRPFDASRTGFIVSEAAAVMLYGLEADEGESLSRHGERRRVFDGREDGAGQRPVVIEGFGLGADATHLTNVAPDGRSLAYVIGRALAGRGIDLVHAYGTGTIAHDPVELGAIEASVPEGDPRASLYSHKGALGHSLGASGLVSVVLNCLAHRDSVVPPNVQSREPVATKRVEIAAERRSRAVRRSLAIAAGFGGTVAAVALKTLVLIRRA